MRDRLIFLALVVLDEAVTEARKRSVKPTVALRLALAYLYSVSGQKDRRVFDRFWQMATGQSYNAGPDENYIRGTYVCTFLQGICKSVGVEYTDLASKIRATRDRTTIAKGHE